jgi:predicted transposase/invertase (TIGR01784 family)
MYVFTHLSDLQDRPKKLQDRVFKKLFEAAEIAKFSPAEREAYEESLKYYRDIKNVVDTSKEEGKEERSSEIAREMKENGESVEKIIKYTGLSKQEIEKL